MYSSIQLATEWMHFLLELNDFPNILIQKIRWVNMFLSFIRLTAYACFKTESLLSFIFLEVHDKFTWVTIESKYSCKHNIWSQKLNLYIRLNFPQRYMVLYTHWWSAVFNCSSHHSFPAFIMSWIGLLLFSYFPFI